MNRLVKEETYKDEFGNDVVVKYYEKDSILDGIKNTFVKKDNESSDSGEEKSEKKLTKKGIAAITVAGVATVVGAVVIGVSKIKGRSNSDDEDLYLIDDDSDESSEDSDVVSDSTYIEVE